MKTYGKIETLFSRDEKFRVTEQLRRPIFATISHWRATEKVDGTNIRIGFARDGEGGEIFYRVAGKSDDASIPAPLLEHCNATADGICSEVAIIMDQFSLDSYTLYGEGYGPKIQGGGDYRDDQGFILFDVLAGDKFLDDDKVTETAQRFGMPRVPDFGELTLTQAIDDARRGFDSRCSVRKRPAEGLVLRTLEPLYDNRGERLIVKLKTKDWK